MLEQNRRDIEHIRQRYLGAWISQKSAIAQLQTLWLSKEEAEQIVRSWLGADGFDIWIN